MSSIYGNRIRVSIFGQSHSKAVGAVIDGLPAGLEIDMEALRAFVARRAPGQNDLSTARREADSFDFLSGVFNDTTTGAPLGLIIPNTDTRSKDYSQLKDIPRPGHADYTAEVKYGGFQDHRGGGHFSGRLTAPLVVAGGICIQLLEKHGIFLGAHLERVKDVTDDRFDPISVSKADFEAVQARRIPTLNPEAGERMAQVILEAKQARDSVGGIIEAAIVGLPVGLGDPIFEGMENRLARILFGIPAVKGVEFGNGFEAADLLGSENNDAFRIQAGKVVTVTNRHGGILGGITTGMPLITRVCIKPTSSIFKDQDSVSLSKMENATLSLSGRHDPCIALRAVPVVEAACAIAIVDALLESKGVQI